MNFGLLGSAGSVPTVLHDATDTGTDYILKHLILVGPKGDKTPGSAGYVLTVLHDATDTGADYILGGGQGCQTDTQGLPNSTKMNPARLVGGFLFIEFWAPW